MPQQIYLPVPQRTEEFDRIFSLPRRSYDDAAVQELIGHTTAMLATDPSAAFRGGQAISVAEFLTLGSVAACLDTGLGKTLLGLVLASLLPPSAKCAFCMPSGLIDKTKAEAKEFSKSWKLRNDVDLIGYNDISSRKKKGLLDERNYDLLIFDEVQNVTTGGSARGRRVTRHIEEHPVRRPRVVVMSASLADRDINHAAKAFRWALGRASPLPIREREIESWAAALDPPQRNKPISGPGILGAAAKQSGDANARAWYLRRVAESPGVVVRFSEGVGAAMRINRIDVKLPAEAKRMIKAADEGLDPDGNILNTDSDVARIKWQIARGFFQYADPPPPREFVDARTAWQAVCRGELDAGTADSPGELVDLICEGKLPQWVRDTYDAFALQSDAYNPTVHARNLHDNVVNTAAAWLKAHPRGIAWVKHLHLGHWLSKVSGLPFFAAGGGAIENRVGPCIASISAHSEGRNLQYEFSDNLLVEVPSSARTWHQLMARTHRSGQLAHEVTYDVLCPEDGFGPDGSSSLVRMARAHTESVHRQLPYKMLIADKTFHLSPATTGEIDPWWVD